jgi:hypothetical protein
MYMSNGRNDEPGTPISHDGDHGFCSTCGMVWPCSWARRHAMAPVYTIPTPRLPTAWS